MLEQFPGRTLEELDQMDWVRYQRAIAARIVQRIEMKRLIGIQKPDALSTDEWALVADHDKLLAEHGQL